VSPTSALVGAIVASLWQASVLALGFALARQVTANPRWRYWVALGTLALQVAWPATVFVRLLHVPLKLGSPATLETSGQWGWVPMAWAAGVAVMLVRLMAGLVTVRRWVSRSGAPPPALVQRLEAVRAKMTGRAVRWAVSAQVSVPLTVGAWRPVVFLPVTLVTGVPGPDLELLVAHELMHVRRYDYLVNLAQSLVEAALFFHPAMWWVSRCAREEREYCCDDGVVTLFGAAKPYARALLSLEESLSPIAVAVPSSGGAFMHRIRRLLGAQRSSSPPSPSPSLLLGVPLGLLIVATGACAVSLRTSPTPVVDAPPALVPALRTLCGDLHAKRARPEMATVAAEDQMTVVLADLGEANPLFERFLGEVAKVPPAQRRDTFKRSVSRAVGGDWQCADFDALWDAPQP